MVSHIFIIYLKHYHIIIILKTNNFSTIFNIKIWKIKHWLHLLWFLWMWLQSMLYWIYKCSTLRVQQFLPSKPNFCNFLNFQQHQEHCQIPIFFFSFYWKNVSIINSFHTIVPNSLKLSWCTLTHCTLSKNIKRNLNVTKQNKLSCFINR